MTTALATTGKKSILEVIGSRYSIDPAKVMQVLSATAFRQGKDEAPLSPEEFQAALIVANQYELNPFTKEIFAMRSKGKLMTVVSIDGWSSLINRHPQLDGIEFNEHFENGKIAGVTCKIHRKDRSVPTVVTEYLAECKRPTEPWEKWPVRMLRHKAMIQCARLAFGFAGIVEPDEAERSIGPIIDAQIVTHEGQTRTAAVAQKLKQKKAAPVAEVVIEAQPEPAAELAQVFDPLEERFDILGWSAKERADFRKLESTEEQKIDALDAEINRMEAN